MLGLQLENFLEGYAKATMAFAEVLSTFRKVEHVTLVNINDLHVSLLRIVNDIYPRLSLKRIRVLDVIHYPYLSTFLGGLLTEIVDDCVLLIDGRLWVTLPLNRRRISSIAIYSRNHLRNLLIYLKKCITYMMRGARQLERLIVFNPYINYEHTFIKLIKAYPPIHELFFNIGKRVLQERPYNERVVFKLMGRLHPYRGVREAIRAFKVFKRRNSSAKVKLIVDSFHEDVAAESRVIGVDGDVELSLWNPLILIKKGLITPKSILYTIAKKYAESSCILLPYTSYQFIEPPLTLLEALATGSFVVASDIVTLFINDEVIYEVRHENIIEDLVNAFEYLYEIYDSSYYWSLRQRAYEYALKNFSFEAIRNKIFNALGDVLD